MIECDHEYAARRAVLEAAFKRHERKKLLLFVVLPMVLTAACLVAAWYVQPDITPQETARCLQRPWLDITPPC